MKKFLAALTYAFVLVTPAFALAQTSFTITVTGTWTLPATGDTNAIAQLQAQLADQFAPATLAFLLASAVISPVQRIPGVITFDASVVFEAVSPALTLSDSLTKVTLTSVGTAVLKIGRVQGTRENE